MQTMCKGPQGGRTPRKAVRTGIMIAACLFTIMILLPVFAQVSGNYKYGYYIGLDDIDNDMWLYPYDEPGLYTIEFYFGDIEQDLQGTAKQEGNKLTFEVLDSYVSPIGQKYYHGTLETSGNNEYTVYLTDSYKEVPDHWEVHRFCWISE